MFLFLIANSVVAKYNNFLWNQCTMEFCFYQVRLLYFILCSVSKFYLPSHFSLSLPMLRWWIGENSSHAFAANNMVSQSHLSFVQNHIFMSHWCSWECTTAWRGQWIHNVWHNKKKKNFFIQSLGILIPMLLKIFLIWNYYVQMFLLHICQSLSNTFICMYCYILYSLCGLSTKAGL